MIELSVIIQHHIAPHQSHCLTFTFPCSVSLESQDDNVRKHAQLGPEGRDSGPQDMDAAAHTSDGQWVSLS